MTISFTSDPVRILPKRPVRLRFQASAGNFVRAWCVAAPSGSKLRRQLDDTGASRIIVFSGQSGQLFAYDFDVGGVYEFSCDEITSGTAHGGVYDTDPNKAPIQDIIGTPTTLTIEVGSRIALQLGTGNDTAELRLYCWGASVHPTDLAHHGELTPAIVKPKTTKARAASESAAVRQILDTLTTYSPAAMVGDVAGTIDGLIGAYNAHRVSPTFHPAADTDHAIPTDFLHATSTAGQREALGRLARELSFHVSNDRNYYPDPPDPPEAGPGSATYHSAADWRAYPHVSGARDLVGVYVWLADLWRRFEIHRLSTAAHLVADTDNAAPALSPLLALHSAFLTQVLDMSAPAPANEHSAVQLLISGGGMTEGHP